MKKMSPIFCIEIWNIDKYLTLIEYALTSWNTNHSTSMKKEKQLFLNGNYKVNKKHETI